MSKIYIVKWDWTDATYGVFTSEEAAHETLRKVLSLNEELEEKDLIIEVIELDKFYPEGWPGTRLGDTEE